MNFTVYEHINKLNGKRYVGMTGRKPEDRWGPNGSNYTTSPHFWSAIQQYGWDNFDHVIVAENLSIDDAVELEMNRIRIFGTIENGYNLSTGGEHQQMSEVARSKLSASMMGNKNGLGKPCSPEKAKKISDAQRGRRFTLEHRRLISEAKKGKSHPPPSEDTRKRISDSHSKSPVYCHETDEVYESVQECARHLNLDASNVSAVCRGKYRHAHGYHLEYLNAINA